ncbi:MAG: carbon starvation protein A, partial [Microbacteriaceae bacterium]|nr:carbon starvation protein A [Microbacteriaceae bacterium]
HGVVSSGTTARQLDKETDARFVGYFGAVGEGLLSLGTIIAVSSGIESIARWEEIYASFGGGGVPAFVEGGGNILNMGLGIPTGLSATILATMAVLFAATTMDTGVRLQRFVIAEIGERIGFKLTPLPATIIALGLTIALTFGAAPDGTGGMTIWPLFGTTNQLLAALTLSVLAVILIRKRRPSLPIILPLLFVLVMTVWALVIQLGQFMAAQNWLLLVLGSLVLVAAVWTVIESFAAINRARQEPPEAEDADGVERRPLETAGTGPTPNA